MAVLTYVEDGILYAVIDNPPVNALSVTERSGIVAAIEQAEGDSAVQAVVIKGTGRIFVAGADIGEFGKPAVAPHLPDVVAAIEACSKPVIAAINGAALGGGLEIALGCHYRFARPNAKLGFPEVTLGIVPGAGGTQRLPRLIDPLLAARMITSGQPVSGSEALESGLVDELVEGEFDDLVGIIAASRPQTNLADRRLSIRAVPWTSEMGRNFEVMREGIARKARGAIAPLEALELVKTATTSDFASGITAEREVFLRLREGPQAAALRHIFFAEREAAKLPLESACGTPKPVDTVGVIGAGTMGSGIAISLLNGGYTVKLVDSSAEALARGRDYVTQHFSKQAANGRIPDIVRDETLTRLIARDDFASLADCDLVVEAAFESPDVKRDIFVQLGRICKPDAVLATNTSYLDVDVIAAASGRPEAVVGMHYFSPAHVMKLLEIVRPKNADSDALATALRVAKRTDKQVVFAGVCNGFIGNRLLRAYTREAGLLLIEGASIEQIDDALEAFGMAMGPFSVADLSGIDIGYSARQSMPAGVFEPLAVAVHDGLVENGALGRKTRAGFYRYDAGVRLGIHPLADEILQKARATSGVPTRLIDDIEIVERTMFALAAEGGTIVDEGIAVRPGDIDVVFVNGYGFPRWRGGPMFFADQCGRDVVRARIAAWQNTQFGKWWNFSSLFNALNS